MAQTPEEKAAYDRAYYAAQREKIRKRKAAFYIANKEKVLKQCAAYRSTQIASNPSTFRKRCREHNRKYKGLPSPTRPCPLVCECCGKPPTKIAFAIEHCHTSGMFRGWTCGSCNRGIGLLGDSIEGLMNAVRFLERAAPVSA